MNRTTLDLVTLAERVERLVDSVAEQQAWPDESWRPECAALKAEIEAIVERGVQQRSADFLAGYNATYATRGSANRREWSFVGPWPRADGSPEALRQAEALDAYLRLPPGACCERDADGDGNCDRHPRTT